MVLVYMFRMLHVFLHSVAKFYDLVMNPHVVSSVL